MNSQPFLPLFNALQEVSITAYFINKSIAYEGTLFMVSGTLFAL